MCVILRHFFLEKLPEVANSLFLNQGGCWLRSNGAFTINLVRIHEWYRVKLHLDVQHAGQKFHVVVRVASVTSGQNPFTGDAITCIRFEPKVFFSLAPHRYRHVHELKEGCMEAPADDAKLQFDRQ
jgi:hypothetical protein